MTRWLESRSSYSPGCRSDGEKLSKGIEGEDLNICIGSIPKGWK